MMSESAKAVFLSYASQDTDAAQRVCDSLRAGGIEVWFDQSDLRGGDAWDAASRKQVKDCAPFVPLISANTEARSEGYFRREWNLAMNRMLDMAEDQSFLLPVVIDDTPEMTARAPDRFRERQWTRLPGGLASSEFTARVARLLEADRAIAPTASGGSQTNCGRRSRSLRGGLLGCRIAVQMRWQQRGRQCPCGCARRRDSDRDVAFFILKGDCSQYDVALRKCGC
jgi:hypothetical protein